MKDKGLESIVKDIYYLSDAPPGKYYVVDVGATGTRFAIRMIHLGLYKGVEIKKLRKSRHGPIVIKLKGAKYAIGRGKATKILVVKK